MLQIISVSFLFSNVTWRYLELLSSELIVVQFFSDMLGPPGRGTEMQMTQVTQAVTQVQSQDAETRHLRCDEKLRHCEQFDAIGLNFKRCNRSFCK